MLVRSFSVANLITCKKDGSSSTGLSLRELSVTFDSTWAPFCQMSLTVVNPGVASLAAIDPRAGLRVRHTMGQDDLAGNVYTKPFDLSMRGRTIDWAAGTATIAATSDEAVLQDWAQGVYGTGGYPDNSGGITEATTNAGYAQNVGFFRDVAAPLVNMNEHSVPTVQDADDMWAPGVNAWDYSSALALLAGAYLMGDELGKIRYVLKSYATDTTTQQLGDANIINVQDGITRDDAAWGNYAIVTFQPPSGASTTAVGYVSSDSGLTPRKSINVTQNRRKPNSGNAATAIRTSAQKRGRTLTVDAVLDIRARPNAPAVAAYQGQTYNGIIRSVTMNLPAGTMNLTIDVTE